MTTPTLALEALMTHPRFPEIAAQIRATLPSHLVDQADAAASDTDGVMVALTSLFGGRTGAATPGQLDGWLRLGVLDTWVGFMANRAATCRHNPHPLRPQPVFAAAWKPGLVTCAACVNLFRLPPGAAADMTCDACGRICGGGDTGDPIHPSLVQFGPMVFQYGTCPDCDPLRLTETQDLPRPRGSGRVKTRGKRGRGRGRRR